MCELRTVLGSCGELDDFVSIPDEGVMAFLRKKVKSGAAVGKRVLLQEQAPTPTISSQQPSQLNVQDKGKGKMVEPEPVKKLSKKDQLMLDEELAFKLQAEEEEEERLAREKSQQTNEVNIAWDDVQARVEADY
ncbi:hypothetical protein Tco_0858239 [Tanacetum coccineum]|uniref:Uncharacterized protein n=1 Tax=Tanacetum coccineum TaxID=301880 RepID=A0ABQ5BBB0_9ASTR